MPFVHQQEVDPVINALIVLAARFEEVRDAAPYESQDYWRAHDQAIELHLQAERMMHGGAFWHTPNPDKVAVS